MEREYTTGLCKGQGMLPETLRILRACTPGTSKRKKHVATEKSPALDFEVETE